MSLDCMSLDELEAFCNQLGTLCDAGRVFRRADMKPMFDMTPGCLVTITVPFRMPHRTQEDEADNNEALFRVFQSLRAVPVPSQSTEAASDPAGEAVMLSPAPVDSPPVMHPAGGLTEPEPEPETAVIEQTPSLLPKVDDSGPSAGGNGQGSTQIAPGATKLVLGPLTDDEKTYIRQAKDSLKHNYEIAYALNRKVQTIGLYVSQMKSIWAKDAEPVADPAPVITQIETTAPPAPMPAPAGDANSYAAYYAQIRADGWDLGLDQTLMTMACDGWTMADIGLDLGFDGKKVKARFDALTGLTKLQGKEDTTQLRLHNRRYVLDWLIRQHLPPINAAE